MIRLLTVQIALVFGVLHVFVAFCPAGAAEFGVGEARKVRAEPVLPVLCGQPKEVRVVIDLNSDTATTQLELCAPGRVKTASATLTGGDFTSRMTQLGLGASMLFTLPKETTSRPSVPIGPIDPGTVVVVKLDLGKIWEAGVAEAPLRINGVEAARLVAEKYRLPFGVKVDATDTEKPQFILERGESYAVVLKNEDPVTYRINWTFVVAGATSQGNLIVTPRSTASFSLTAADSIFSWWTGLLKDRDEDGKLTLQFSPPGVADAAYWPSKVVPVKVHLRSVSELSQRWCINVSLLLVLVVGALFSYFGSVGLPNRLKRSEYREALAQLGQRITGLSQQIDSRLRVMVRVQRRRLDELLSSRQSTSPDLTRVFGLVSTGLMVLEKQVGLAEEIDIAHRRLQYLDAKNAPPSLLAGAEEAIWKAADEISLLVPDDVRLTRSRVYLDTANGLLVQADAEKQDEAKIEAFAAELWTKYQQTVKDLTAYLNEPLYKSTIQPRLGNIFQERSEADFKSKSMSNAAWLDQIVEKRDLVRQFLQIYTTNTDEEFRRKLTDQLGQLVKDLGKESYKAIRHARLLVREAQEGVFPDDLAQAAKAGQARIEIDPTTPRMNNPVQFGIRFSDPRLNNATARLECEGRWSFGHDNYEEYGWNPVHYFPRAGSLSLTFTFRCRGDGQDIPVTRTLEVEKERAYAWWWSRDRDRAELLRLLVTLLPATVGLLSGAREQFLKMDTVSAFFTVFLLGFSSDTVKNLISQSLQKPADPPVPVSGRAAAGTGAETPPG